MYIDEGTAELIDDIERIHHGTEFSPYDQLVFGLEGAGLIVSAPFDASLLLYLIVSVIFISIFVIFFSSPEPKAHR